MRRYCRRVYRSIPRLEPGATACAAARHPLVREQLPARWRLPCPSSHSTAQVGHQALQVARSYRGVRTACAHSCAIPAANCARPHAVRLGLARPVKCSRHTTAIPRPPRPDRPRWRRLRHHRYRPPRSPLEASSERCTASADGGDVTSSSSRSRSARSARNAAAMTCSACGESGPAVVVPVAVQHRPVRSRYRERPRRGGARRQDRRDLVPDVLDGMLGRPTPSRPIRYLEPQSRCAQLLAQLRAGPDFAARRTGRRGCVARRSARNLERLLEDVESPPSHETRCSAHSSASRRDCAVDLYLMVGLGAATRASWSWRARDCVVCLELRGPSQTYGMGSRHTCCR